MSHTDSMNSGICSMSFTHASTSLNRARPSTTADSSSVEHRHAPAKCAIRKRIEDDAVSLFVAMVLVGQHPIERGRRIVRDVAMQRERDEHRWHAVCCGRSAEPAVELRYPIRYGLLSPIASGCGLAEQIELSGHAIGVVPPGDDVDPVVFRRSRPACRYGLSDLTGSESLVRIAKRRKEVGASRAWKTERHCVADDVAARCKGRAHLKHVGDSRLRTLCQFEGLESIFANG